MRALFQFLLLGVLIFAADRWLLDRGDDPEPTLIEISSDRLDAIRRGALASSGRLPDPAELDALIDAETAEEMLYREALALGLAQRDEVVRRRLVRNMRFLNPEDERSSEALFEEALSLGMDRSDLVVRRRLIQRMRLAIEARAQADEPTEAELASYLTRHQDRFSSPPRVSFSQVFLDPARRGSSAGAEARMLLSRLRAAGAGPEAREELGDPFLAPSDDALRSERELAKLFGPEFAGRLMDLTPGSWEGPLPSSHGLHLVWVHEQTPGEPIPLGSIRNEVRYALLAERGEGALQEAIEELRDHYQVRIAAP
jgi:parvulin-like peptidyl-prolyl isomerase